MGMAVGGACPGLSGEVDPPGGAVPAGRTERRHRQGGRAEDAGLARPTGDHRQPCRRRRRARHDFVAKSDPDGYTIAIASAGALAISYSLQDKILYDPLKDLALITLVAKVPELLVASTDVPVANVKELVALAKAKPGQINYGSTGPGSMPHLAGALLRINAGIDIVHVPYLGAAPAVGVRFTGSPQVGYAASNGSAAKDRRIRDDRAGKHAARDARADGTGGKSMGCRD
jgi:hypothetical protein